jgi:hypothetical protein
MGFSLTVARGWALITGMLVSAILSSFVSLPVTRLGHVHDHS